MRELEYLKVINETLADSSLLGDDCAYLKEFNLCVTHDTLVEDVHFTLDTTTAQMLGEKAVNVNLSDLAAAGAEPLYITISLSLPKSVDESFVKKFYQGVQLSCLDYNVKVAGGDLTGSDKVFISICAMGKKYNDILVSRNASKSGDVIVTTGVHGDSAGGLKLLLNGQMAPSNLVQKHLLPKPHVSESRAVMESCQKAGVKELAMMDTSDGLGDGLYKLSKGCGLAFDIDFESIPISSELKSAFPDDYKDLALWGGEDFELLFTLPEFVFDTLDKTRFFKIGRVSNKPFSMEDEAEFEKKSFKHF